MSDYRYAIERVIEDYYNCYISRSMAIHRLEQLGLTYKEADFEIYSYINEGVAA